MADSNPTLAPVSLPAPAPTPTPSVTGTPPPEPQSTVEPALERQDVPRIADLGLGRGIDATTHTPWLNKSSFQVRRVCFEELVGTDEGGVLQSYVNQINSVNTQQVKMKSSVTIPQSPVSIGVDAEMSRSASSSRRAVGKKVLTRTISYCEDMDDLPLMSDLPSLVRQTSLSPRLRKGAAKIMPTFEERLAEWICTRLLKESTDAPETKDDDTTFLERLTTIIQKGSPEDRAEVITACREFVYHFRITHYVNAIELGAAEYCVMSTQQYQEQVSVGGNAGVDQVGKASASTTVTSKGSQKSSSTRKIGIINANGTVTRRTYGEAVVGVKAQPISRLVKTRFLQLAMKLAIVEYMDDQTNDVDGPYIIACDDNNLFLTVNRETHFVTAVSDIQHASPFYIMQREDRDNHNEFLIAYYKEFGARMKAADQTSGEQAIPRYLEAPVTVCGFNTGPLKMKYNVKEEQCRYVLHDRLRHNLTAVDVTDWISGSETYYINCSRRRFARDGYLAVKKVQGARGAGDEPTFITCCFPSIGYHSDNVFMLFHLLHPTLHQMAESRSDQVKSIISQLGRITGNAIAGLEP